MRSEYLSEREEKPLSSPLGTFYVHVDALTALASYLILAGDARDMYLSFAKWLARGVT